MVESGAGRRVMMYAGMGSWVQVANISLGKMAVMPKMLEKIWCL